MLAAPMSPQAPLWLKLVLRLERAVGGPVEAAVGSDVYFDLVTELTRAQQRLTGVVERGSRRGLHLLNLPAGSDIRRLREQMARIDRRLVQITKELEASDAERDAREAQLEAREAERG